MACVCGKGWSTKSFHTLVLLLHCLAVLTIFSVMLSNFCTWEFKTHTWLKGPILLLRKSTLFTFYFSKGGLLDWMQAYALPFFFPKTRYKNYFFIHPETWKTKFCFPHSVYFTASELCYWVVTSPLPTFILNLSQVCTILHPSKCLANPTSLLVNACSCYSSWKVLSLSFTLA